MICIDFETKSYADLTKVGAWAYSEDPSTMPICLCYGIDYEPIRTWVPGDEDPTDLFDAIAAGKPVEAHNVSFEISIWKNVMVKRFGWPDVPLELWRDTAAVAAYYALPTKLDKLAKLLGYGGKDVDGGRLISKYSKLHLKSAKPVIPPEDLKRFVEYCKRDVELEQAVSDYLGDLPDEELKVFQLDLKIELRGLRIDLEGVDAATKVVEEYGEVLDGEFRKLTGFGPGQLDKVHAWFEERGYPLENMQAEYLEDALKEGLEIEDGVFKPVVGDARRALELRLATSKASVKKLMKMRGQRGSDGTAKFQCRYHGAQTGRWTGTGFQPLNLNRGYDEKRTTPEDLVYNIKTGNWRWVKAMYGNPIEAVARASRHWITASEGHEIMAGDFVSIEAVVLACLAGEKWKVEAFRQKKGIYELMACKIYNLDPELANDPKKFKEKYPAERQDGKTGELAFGFAGGLNAWLNFDNSGRHTDERIVEICKAWRAEHPEIVKFWSGIERAAVDCVMHHETTYYMAIQFDMIDEWLAMTLPDGKKIWYREPYLRQKMPPWHRPVDNKFGPAKPACAAGTCDCEPQPELCYLSVKGGRVQRTSTYGGKLCLAEDTEVLTNRGWKRIVNVQYDDLVWDGVSWVAHSGVVYNGDREVVRLLGVELTGDHPVLTTEGWVLASQSEGYNRADCGIPRSSELLGVGRGEVALECRVPGLLSLCDPSCQRAEEAQGPRCERIVRVSQGSEHIRSEDDARDVQASGLCGLEVYGRPLFATVASGVGELWRAGHKGLRSVAQLLRGFLVGYGADVQARSSDRADQQRRTLPSSQLPLGHARGPGVEPQDQSADRHTARKDDRVASVPKVRGKTDDDTIPACERVVGTRRVYDITNCGPRNRFVVRTGDGRGLIVHNCENAVQATARQILKPAMLRLDNEGFPIVLSVYDEIVCDVPNGFAKLKDFEDLIREREGWFKDWPIDVDAWQGKIYRK